ncbi:hypothetical protein B0J18DRAFT_192679 [Chaetomium sp. MPI-SDFR-AT-0129]|nr:hypothetical protein B0J18DRAFT_192679 [Chaetomium sp. MPI-SDFR-AT-0129]
MCFQAALRVLFSALKVLPLSQPTSRGFVFNISSTLFPIRSPRPHQHPRSSSGVRVTLTPSRRRLPPPPIPASLPEKRLGKQRGPPRGTGRILTTPVQRSAVRSLELESLLCCDCSPLQALVSPLELLLSKHVERSRPRINSLFGGS